MLFFDGTLWTDDEMIKQKVGIKTGKRMGHISMSGEEGSLNIFKDVKINRKIPGKKIKSIEVLVKVQNN